MNGKRVAATLSIGVVVFTLFAVFVYVVRHPSIGRAQVLTGAVLTADPDPSKQAPIANATITALEETPVATAHSDSTGLFNLTLPGSWNPGRRLRLRFESPDHQPLEMPATVNKTLVIARLMPLSRKTVAAIHNVSEHALANLRVRYTTKATTMNNIGSLAEAFQVRNVGDQPCQGKPPCSPDGKWKATVGSVNFDAGEGNQFVDPRVSCIAGPCPFTRVETQQLSDEGRTLTIAARDWSDTATYLVEAEVSRPKVIDMVRLFYPIHFGTTLTFSLPPTAEGPCLEADLDGLDIVFPFGPDLIVSWGACTYQAQPDHSQVYRCELKPGYRFK
ncbi:MAG: hypothetical protein JO217_15955 [Acidobacteriaceae bacterium]|nr:hypothetical protein [Acidobacteriaceae bacterium]MBV9444177.1 hypothetical protein [Acidobacteriaceae bacterium]